MASDTLQRLRASAVFIGDEPSAAALCTERPPIGLLDGGAANLIGSQNGNASATLLAACLEVVAQIQKHRRNGRKAASRPINCAVVGSGGTLRFSALGPSIDKHDAIIRFNGATTLMPFSDDVGSRTTTQLSTLVPWRHWRRRVDAKELDRQRDNVL